MIMIATFAVLPFQWGFYLLDTRKSPQLLYKHKIQTSEKAEMQEEGHARAWGHHTEMYVNTMVITFLIASFIEEDRSFQANAPSFAKLCMEIGVLSVCNEIGFYWSHRLLHVPYFYKRLHKIHHEFKAPAAACGTYSHWLEHWILIAPLAVPIVCFGSHLLTAVVWIYMALTGISLHHSGYEFPWTYGDMATQHDLHHECFNGNYGVFGWFDVLCGTSIDKTHKKMVRDLKKTKTV